MRTDRFLQAEREVPPGVAVAAEAEVLEAVDKVASPGEQSRMQVRTSRKKIPEKRVALQKKTIPRKKNKRRARQQVS